MKFKQLCALAVVLVMVMACTGKKRNTEGDVAPSSTTENELSDSKPAKITGATAVMDGTWILTTFNKEIIETSDAYKIPTLKIEADEGKVIGNAGCNQYTGSIVVKGDKQVNIKAKRVSELDCPGTSLEDDFLKAITAEDLAYRIQDDNQLIFYTDSTTIMFKKSK